MFGPTNSKSAKLDKRPIKPAIVVINPDYAVEISRDKSIG